MPCVAESYSASALRFKMIFSVNGSITMPLISSGSSIRILRSIGNGISASVCGSKFPICDSLEKNAGIIFSPWLLIKSSKVILPPPCFLQGMHTSRPARLRKKFIFSCILLSIVSHFLFRLIRYLPFIWNFVHRYFGAAISYFFFMIFDFDFSLITLFTSLISYCFL